MEVKQKVTCACFLINIYTILKNREVKKIFSHLDDFKKRGARIFLYLGHGMFTGSWVKYWNPLVGFWGSPHIPGSRVVYAFVGQQPSGDCQWLDQAQGFCLFTPDGLCGKLPLPLPAASSSALCTVYWNAGQWRVAKEISQCSFAAKVKLVTGCLTWLVNSVEQSVLYLRKCSRMQHVYCV